MFRICYNKPHTLDDHDESRQLGPEKSNPLSRQNSFVDVDLGDKYTRLNITKPPSNPSTNMLFSCFMPTTK